MFTEYLKATHATLGSGINTTSSALLQSEFGQDFVEASVFRQVDQLAVDTSADTSTYISAIQVLIS